MWQKNYCATCHNFEPSLTIVINDENQYFEKKIIYMLKNLPSAMC
jgi:thymidine kinase